jgi:formate hydrogenlyase subunit 3/multisubunit Na+/H+ antiporter MnhD subunit
MIIPKIGLISWLYLYNYLFFDQMIFFAIISIFIGGIGMISQINIKRFLTFSSIAQ